jgi:aminoglycoside/choline kinase family phosphotransferase
MDAPPPQEDCLPFVRVAGFLEAMNLNAPRIIEADLERGFLLLTDLGSTQYLESLEAHPEQAETLYGDAIEALLVMQSGGAAFQALLPPYNAELLSVELSLFHDWLCETHLGIEFSDEEEQQWQDVCSLLSDNALDQPQSFVHRDYHSRNLMLTPERNPGILDFQDSVEGPFTYDIVSLLKDCYIKWPADQVLGWADRFYTRLPTMLQATVTADQFIRYFELMGVQRHLKAAGIFARLNHRDGKPGYLDDIPRTLSYITELEGRYDELTFLVELINTRCLPLLGRRT